MKYVTFYGDECSGTGLYGTICAELMNEGIEEVVEITSGSGDYEIYFTESFDNRNYLILATSNVAGTSGAITNIGGNNDVSSTEYGITQAYVRMETRKISNNANWPTDASDYVSVVVGTPMNDTSYPDMKWVTFDGSDCSGGGIQGTTCNIFGSAGVSEVVIESTGRYIVYLYIGSSFLLIIHMFYYVCINTMGCTWNTRYGQ